MSYLSSAFSIIHCNASSNLALAFSSSGAKRLKIIVKFKSY